VRIQQSTLIPRHKRQEVSAADILVIINTEPIAWQALLSLGISSLEVLSVDKGADLVLHEAESVEANLGVELVESLL